MTSSWTTVAVTGHRRLPAGAAQQWLNASISRCLSRMRDEFGVEKAYSGLAVGADHLFADEVLRLGMPLYGAAPFPGQPTDRFGPQWSRAQRDHWEYLVGQCQRVDYVSPVDPNTRGERLRMLHARNDHLLGVCDVLLAIWAPGNLRSGTASCIRKAVGTGKPVVLINVATRSSTRPRMHHWARMLPGLTIAGGSDGVQ